MAIKELLVVATIAYWYALPSLAKKTRCGEGTFLNGGSCQDCPSGTYQNATDATSCKPCPKRTFNPYVGAQGVDLCRVCPSGTFNNGTGASRCTRCPAGTTSTAGSSECISCPPGKFVYLSFPQKRLRCEPCDFDYFNDDPLALECKPCPPGTVAKKGKSECRRCKPGEEPFDFGRCFPCFGSSVDNSVNDGTFNKCQKCPAGFVPNGKRVKCNPCPRKMRRFTDFCIDCSKGRNSFVQGADFCIPDNTPCPSNFFQNFLGACQKCNLQERFDKDEKTCKPCGENEISEGGLATACKPCPANSKATRRGCVCQAGAELTANGACVKCRPGTGRFGSEELPFCRQCDRGWFASKQGQQDCRPCPDGEVQPQRGQAKCIPCPKGFSTQINALANFGPEGVQCVSTKTNCPVGQKRILDKDGVFLLCTFKGCPPGSSKQTVTIANTKSSRCLVCEDFCYRFDPKRKKCIPCGRNEIIVGNVCKKCKKNEVVVDCVCRCITKEKSVGLVGGKCTRCPAGTFATVGTVGCTKCPVGTFQRKAGQLSCMNCPRGTFNSKLGAKGCQKCPRNSSTYQPGSASCVVPGSLA